jgi:hypothetical protein
MDTLALDAGQVTALGDSAENFSFAAGTDITVMGTSFLNAGSGHFDDLLSSSSNLIQLDDSYLANLAADSDGATVFAANAIDAHISAISTSGAETFIDALSASDLSYALAGLNFDSAQQITLLDAMNVTTLVEADFQSLNNFLGSADVSASLTLANVQSDYVDTAALSEALAGLQDDLSFIGVDQILITDDLANALADANIEFLQSIAKGGSGIEVDLEAVSDDESGNAYINASLQDLAAVGVDEVSASDGVEKIEISLRDANESGTLFTLDDLPNFNVADGFVVSLAVDEDDLAALLASDDGAANFAQLAASGITEINYTGDIVHDGLEATLTSSGLTLSNQALSVAEVELLGLGDEPADPLALFYKA